jgi:hypothetical protein
MGDSYSFILRLKVSVKLSNIIIPQEVKEFLMIFDFYFICGIIRMELVLRIIFYNLDDVYLRR